MIKLNIHELIFVAWRRERLNEKLESLETDFFSKIRPYLNHLETQIKNETDPIIARIFKKRWERVNYLLNDLVDLRLNKHFRDCLMNISPPSVLPDEEQEFRDKLCSIHNTMRTHIFGGISTTSNIDTQNTYSLIQFISNDEMISICSDLKEYGPFTSDEFVILPTDNVNTFIKRKKAKIIKLSK